MPMEQAFTRRIPGVNPIALELDRLAEQRALQTLGRRREPVMLSTTLPSGEDLTVAPSRAAATPEQLAAGQYIPDEEEVAQHSAFLDEMQRRGLQFEPGDPRWGGLEEDEAYDRLFAMSPADREAFLRTFGLR